MESDRNILRGSRIIDVLKRAAAELIDLQIVVNENPPPGITRVNEVYPDGKRVDVYVFGIPELDASMEPGAPLQISLAINYLGYCFRTTSKRGTRGIRYHSLEIPPFIQEIQRRAHYRVAPPSADAVKTLVRFHPDDELIPVETVNVSLGGVLIQDCELVSLPEVDHPVQLVLQSDEGHRLHLFGRIRHVAPAPSPSDDLRIGLEFETVRPRDESDLGHLLARWQREQRRVRTRT
ncbi:PilZ domain-containing protein [bacterium]|nr:PilZ domain-containing protein [bacterium]